MLAFCWKFNFLILQMVTWSMSYIRPLQRPCNRSLGVELLWQIKLMFTSILRRTLKLFFKMVVLQHGKVPRSPHHSSTISVSFRERCPTKSPLLKQGAWMERVRTRRSAVRVCLSACYSRKGALHGESGIRELSVRLASDFFLSPLCFSSLPHRPLILSR